MNKVKVAALLRKLGGSRAGDCVRFAYVTAGGRLATVEGVIVTLAGKDGEYHGLRARVMLTTRPIRTREDGTALFSLDRIVEGQRTVAEEALRGVEPATVAGFVGIPQRVRPAQLCEAVEADARLRGHDGPDAVWAKYEAMDSYGVSEEIELMRDALAAATGAEMVAEI